MDLNLKGKTALVSGSTAGIGFATALGLAKQGASVIVNGRTEERVKAAVAQIREAFPTADVVGFAADLTTAAGTSALVAAHPAVDILVNNLGLPFHKSFETTTDDEWAQQFDVNVISGVRLSRAYLPAMRTRNWGRIIFVSSIAAYTAPVDLLPYSVSKVAQITVARGLAEALAGTNITANTVVVGPTATEAANLMFQQLATQHGGIPVEMVTKMFTDQTLTKRMHSPEEVANMIVYLSSPAGSATTGAALRVDGGSTHHI